MHFNIQSSTLVKDFPKMDSSILSAYCHQGSWIGAEHTEVDVVKVLNVNLAPVWNEGIGEQSQAAHLISGHYTLIHHFH